MAASEVELVVRSTSGPDSVYNVVMDAIGDAIGSERADASTLYDHVDPEMLKWAIDGSNNDDVRVTFTYEGCEVVVRGDGTIVVVAERGDVTGPGVRGESDRRGPSDDRSLR